MASVPPIGIRSLSIQNFRRIDSLQLSFETPKGEPTDIAVIAGPNGCGKTTVLEACLIALGYEGELQGSRAANASRNASVPWRVEAEFHTPSGRVGTTTIGGQRQFWSRSPIPADQHAIAIPVIYFSSWRSPKLVGSLPITAGKRGKRPSDSERNRLWRAKQFFIDSKAHSLMSNYLAPEFNPFEHDLGLLNEVWRMFHPGSDDLFAVEPVGDDPSDGFDVFLCSADGRKCSVDSLSSGQMELFTLFGAMVIAKFREGIVVIDEPELHLDPQWHTLMLRAIRKFMPAVQLLVATHSPKIYESVLSFQRHFLIPPDDPRAKAWNIGPEASPAA